MIKMNESTLRFIQKHADADVRQLALQGTKEPGIDLAFALEQIAGRQKAQAKLPTWAAIDGIIYPTHLSMEQCSSELTARYKAALVKRFVTDDRSWRFVDLTGGFGVDFAFISKAFSQLPHPATIHLTYIERQSQLCAISSNNFKLLGLKAEVVNADGIDYLHTLDHADLIFIDPARRDAQGGRTYGIADCTPNVLELMDELMAKTDRLLLKLSPMLDWHKAVSDLESTKCRAKVCAVHIVSVDNECKELLIEVTDERLQVGEPLLRVVCVNLLSDGTEERFEYDAQHSSLITQHSSLNTQHFLFEPNASIMKAGCFDLLAERFGLHQLDKNSHLFVSDKEVTDFPGRKFVIDKITSMNKRELKVALSGIERANITVRNFPLSAADLRKRLKLKDGGDTYIFATTVQETGHQLFICRK